jgi:hypothetical protein
VVAVVDACRQARYARLREAVLGARVPVGNAACLVAEFERLAHRLNPSVHEPALDYLLVAAQTGTARDIRALRAQVVARFGWDGEFQADQDRLRERTWMSAPVADGGGRFDYRLVVDGEAKAVLEAAVGALAAPRPADGVPDRRPAGQRRLEALVEVVRRGVASADGVPATSKAQLVLTMPLTDLAARLGAGTILGSTQCGDLLGPETARRLACDADLVPAVLGGPGEILDWGRRVRLFTPAQTPAPWLRDRGCSFPDCTTPAAWSDAHHLRHWADGGPTNLGNAALLCGRHHTIVHTRGYHGHLDQDGHLQWDLTPGAYDHWLTQRPAPAAEQAPAHGPAAPSGRGPTTRQFDQWGQGAPPRTNPPGQPQPPPRRP